MFLIRFVWGLIGVLFVLTILFWRNSTWNGIFRSGLVAVWWPAAVLLPPALLLRERRRAAALALPAAGLIIVYGPIFVPRAETPVEGLPTITVMSFNIHKPGDLESNEAIAAILREANADLVALQELGPSPDTLFGPLLEDVYPYQVFYDNPGYPGSGQGVLSKYPILSEAYWLAGGPWNGNLRVEVEIHGMHVVIYNAHPHPPIERGLDPQMESHANVIREIVDRAEAETAPTLIAGDFNLTDQFAPYAWITVEHADAWRTVGRVGLGLTLPDYEGIPLPRLIRADRIFYDEHFRGIECYTLPDSGPSDHVPVIARVQIANP